ncbi:MAG: HAD-IB family phosphatase [Candidatus Peribacteraceae bacterium]
MSRFSFAFDFDSTLVSVESLDELIALSLAESLPPQAAKDALSEIQSITDAGMNGDIDFMTSVTSRLKRAHTTRKHLQAFTKRIVRTVTPGIPAIIREIQQSGCPVFILSGALLECILPIAEQLGIPAGNVFANRPVFDALGNLTGIEPGLLASTDGKTRCLKMLAESRRLRGDVVMVGDGISDLHPYRAGIARHFLGVGFHRRREVIAREAPHYFTSVSALRGHIRFLLRP